MHCERVASLRRQRNSSRFGAIRHCRRGGEFNFRRHSFFYSSTVTFSVLHNRIRRNAVHFRLDISHRRSGNVSVFVRYVQSGYVPLLQAHRHSANAARRTTRAVLQFCRAGSFRPRLSEIRLLQKRKKTSAVSHLPGRGTQSDTVYYTLSLLFKNYRLLLLSVRRSFLLHYN